MQDDFCFSPRPQPYRALKESDSADGEEAASPEKSKEPLPPSPLLSNKDTEVNLLEDIFPNLEVGAQPQPLSQAKSLEDLRTPKEEGDQRCTFDYQVWRGFPVCWGLCSEPGLTAIILREHFHAVG